MSSIGQTAKRLIAIPRLSPKREQERRASVFGMVQSGKTTILGLLHVISAMYANRENEPGKRPRFHSMVEERSSNIRVIAAELRKGMFPEKTPTEHVFEADFLMRFNKPFGEQYIRLPFCETAGETFTKMLRRFGEGQYDIDPMMQDAHLIRDYILNTDAIILIAPVTRGVGIEAEIGAPVQLPDVNLSRLLTGVYKYKTKDSLSNPGHRPIRGIAVFLTKYDALRDFLETNQMNLNTKEGVHAFMSKHFPDTYQVLGWYGLENVRFWATGVEIETEKNELKQVVAKRHPLNPARGYKIAVDHNRNVPVFTEGPFFEFIEWLKTTVMA
jgi:hypothetical protein